MMCSFLSLVLVARFSQTLLAFVLKIETVRCVSSSWFFYIEYSVGFQMRLCMYDLPSLQEALIVACMTLQFVYHTCLSVMIRIELDVYSAGIVKDTCVR